VFRIRAQLTRSSSWLILSVSRIAYVAFQMVTHRKRVP
jgi:hypothetical protein